MTPAMASEPYWAAAPSRRISTRSMALTGMVLMSTATDGGYGRVLVICDEVCRRLPLTRISVYAGLTPRSAAERVFWPFQEFCPCGKLNDGCSFSSAWLRVMAPVDLSWSAVTTSTGAELCRLVVSSRLVPSTTTLPR